MPVEKKHAVVFKNGRKELFYTLKDFKQKTVPEDILMHHAFKSEVDAAMWLHFPDEFPLTKGVYAVKVGFCPGIYHSNKEALKQVTGFSGSKYMAFYTIEAAKKWLGSCVSTMIPSAKKPSTLALSAHNVVGACFCNLHPTGALKIYTDASFKGPDRASYAIHMIDETTGMSITLGGKSTGISNPGEAELFAIVMALRGIDKDSKTRISIYTDCQSLIHHIYSDLRGGKLWDEFYSYAKVFDISVNWVKGHSDDEYNVLCDKLACRLNN